VIINLKILRNGLTFRELLVIMAGIGLLIGCLLPVIQKVREAAVKMAGEDPEFIKKQQEFIKKREAEIDDSKALVPDWYRSSLHPELWMSEIHYNLLILGLFVYPIIAFVATRPARENAWGDFVIVLFCLFIGPEVLAIPLHFVIYLILRVATNESYYVPWQFLAVILQALLMVGLPVIPVVRAMSPSSGSANSRLGASQRNSISMASSRHASRIRRIAHVALRAFLVAIATALGAKVGGWIGGVAAAVIASIIGVFFDGSSHADAGQESNPHG
jgi:hypothetical protein